MSAVILIITAVVSYLIGSINPAILIGKLVSGEDIRNCGSGNAGATNALRTYGKGIAALVVLCDCLKAAVSCLLAMGIAEISPLGSDNAKLGIYAAGIGAVLGHNFPLYFKFKGGKGILVSITALTFADWKIALAVFVISIAVMAITKYVSLGSVLGAVLFIVFAFVFRLNNLPYVIFTTFLGVLAIYRHRANIKRLLNGTESKLTDKKL